MRRGMSKLLSGSLYRKLYKPPENGCIPRVNYILVHRIFYSGLNYPYHSYSYIENVTYERILLTFFQMVMVPQISLHT